LFLISLFSVGLPVTFVFANKQSLFSNEDFNHTIPFSLIISITAFFITLKMIPNFMELNYNKKIFGVDINKCHDIKDLTDPNRKEV